MYFFAEKAGNFIKTNSLRGLHLFKRHFLCARGATNFHQCVSPNARLRGFNACSICIYFIVESNCSRAFNLKRLFGMAGGAENTERV